MEGLAEQLIATYLTRGGKVFIAPQYSIPASGGNGDWACPDFVALDFENREIIVVEVTVASNVSNILSKINDRQSRWFEPVRAKLSEDKIVENDWKIRVLVFVRKSQLEKARKQLSGEPDVSFYAIEDATFDWDYWTDRHGGLPR